MGWRNIALLFRDKKIETIASIIILGSGVVFRLRQYLFNRSLWLDEANLANNFLSKSLQSLLFEDLDNEQAAPPGFLFAVKIAIKLFGSSDIVLRLVPLLAGVFVLVIAYFVAIKTLRTPTARIAFIAFISYSPLLIYYSSEFKQYSVDVFLVFVLLLLGLYYREWKYGIWLLTVAGVLFPWFSHPTLFILAAIGIIDLLLVLVGKNLKQFIKLSLMGSVWFINFWIFYLVSLESVSSNGFLQNYWVHGYPPWPISSGEDVRWYSNLFLEWAFISFQQLGPPPITSVQSWFKIPNLIMAGSMILGGILLWVQSKRTFGIVVGPAIVTLLVSIPKLYPFSGRLILFLIPFGILLFCILVDKLASTHHGWTRILAVPLLVFSIILSINISVKNLVNPYDNHNIKGGMGYMQENFQPGDVLAISTWSQPAYNFYNHHYQVDDLPIAAVIDGENDEPQLVSSLCAFSQPERVWVLFTHRFSERVKLLDALSQRYPLLSKWEGQGAGAYLWDMTNACVP